MSRATRYRGTALAIAWRQLHNLVRNPALFLPPLLMPIFFFTAFAGGLSAIADAPNFGYPDYDNFQFVFVLLQSAAFGGVFTGFAIAADFESGFGRRLLLASRDRTAMIAGYAIVALTRAAFTFAMLFAIALAVGMPVAADAVELTGLIGLAFVFGTAGLMLSAGVALRFRSLQAGPLMQVPVFIALMTAPVFVPIELLSGWVEAVASVNPVTPLLEAGRGLIISDPEKVLFAFAVAIGLAALLAVFAVRGLRRAEVAG
ncbi:MAG TPA: ABC transporter permease [Solirubrobacterales bacterium]